MQPVDINFTKKSVSINTLITKIKDQTLEYVQSGHVDPRVFEFCWCNLYFEPIIVRCNPDLNKFDNNLSYGSFSPGWSAYTGHGLLETLKTFIIEDHVIYGLNMYTKLNGKHFSELPLHLQRKIKETSIDVIMDDTFYNKNNTSVIDFYCEVLNNLK